MNTQWMKQVRKCVGEGLYASNLNAIESAAAVGLEAEESRLAAFVMRYVALSSLEMWQGGALAGRRGQIVNEGLRPAYTRLLDTMERDAPREEIVQSVEGLIGALLGVQSEVRDLDRLDAG